MTPSDPAEKAIWLAAYGSLFGQTIDSILFSKRNGNGFLVSADSVVATQEDRDYSDLVAGRAADQAVVGFRERCLRELRATRSGERFGG